MNNEYLKELDMELARCIEERKSVRFWLNIRRGTADKAEIEMLEGDLKDLTEEILNLRQMIQTELIPAS